MSARLELNRPAWAPSNAQRAGREHRDLNQMEIECLFRNFGRQNLVAPLREACEARAPGTPAPALARDQCLAALELQEQWNAWFAARDQLRSEIRRGRELLEQVRKDIAALRKDLEEWPVYERVCGINPLPEYTQALATKERIEGFLPDWISRQETQLLAITSKMEACARENGLEHLL
jgi:hypothetical protein